MRSYFYTCARYISHPFDLARMRYDLFTRASFISHALGLARMRYDCLTYASFYFACTWFKLHAIIFLHVCYFDCAVPIYMQVMNLNGAPAESVGLVAYLPTLEVSAALKDLPEYHDCAHYIQQQCVGHVLTQIENRARFGFQACIGGSVRVFFPRLGAMTLDTKERVKYFGLRSDRTCGFCRLRHGRSCCRKARRQDAGILNLLHGWATRETHTKVGISQRAKARQSLKRHGWNYQRKCLLHQFAGRLISHALVGFRMRLIWPACDMFV